MTPQGWTKKSKGSAKIYTHPQIDGGRAIVVNHYGVRFDGQAFASLDADMAHALARAA